MNEYPAPPPEFTEPRKFQEALDILAIQDPVERAEKAVQYLDRLQAEKENANTTEAVT